MIPRDTTVTYLYIHVLYAIYFYQLADDKLFMLLVYLRLESDYFSSANTALELRRGVRVPNYLLTNIITNISIVSNPYKYVIIRECNNMTGSYDKYNFLSLREC